MMEQDNLPIGTAQEPVEEARHSPVRTSPIHNRIINYLLILFTMLPTFIFCSFRSTAKNKNYS